MSALPETSFVRAGDLSIAYQCWGSGPPLVMAPGGWGQLLGRWSWPSYARLLEGLGSFATVALFDKRGTGLSDRVGDVPTLEQRMDDVRAVLDAVGSRHAVLLGVSEGGPMCSLFAATHPAAPLGCPSAPVFGLRLNTATALLRDEAT